jgi:SAM-dependent methyltransferase
VQDYYDDLWERLPPELKPPDLELRREFLRSAVRPGERALDLGCGDGTFTAELARAGVEAIGVDVAQAAVRRAAARYRSMEFRRIAIAGPLPFEDCSFDLVWCSEVIEHVADTARWLSDVRRVLAPGGRLLLTTPNHGRVRLALGGIERFSEPLGDHLHLYSRRSLERLLAEFGFAAITVRSAAGPPLLRRVLLARAQR